MDRLRDLGRIERDFWTWKVCDCKEYLIEDNCFSKGYVRTQWDQAYIGCVPRSNELDFFLEGTLSTMKNTVGHNHSRRGKCC